MSSKAGSHHQDLLHGCKINVDSQQLIQNNLPLGKVVYSHLFLVPLLST